MPKPREPINLIVAKGKKHLGKKEIEERKAQELDVPFVDIVPPDYLTAKQKKVFAEIADKLVALGIFTELDVDTLAQYCVARDLYIGYSDQVRKILNKANAVHKWSVVEQLAAECEDQEELVKLLEKIIRRQRGDDLTVLMNLQDKAQKQCLACAKELGLTITSRVKLVIPTPPDDNEDEL